MANFALFQSAAFLLLAAAAPAQSKADLETRPPAIIHKTEPEYTEAARQALEGSVVLLVKVGIDGRARHIRVVRGLGLGLDEKAIETVRQWHFRPALKKGEPAETFATIEVVFRLGRLVYRLSYKNAAMS